MSVPHFSTNLQPANMLPEETVILTTAELEDDIVYTFKVRKEVEEKANDIFDLFHHDNKNWKSLDLEKCIRLECNLSEGCTITPGMSPAEQYFQVHKAAWRHTVNWYKKKDESATVNEVYWLSCKLMNHTVTKELKDQDLQNLMAHYLVQQTFKNEAHMDILTCPCNMDDGRDVYTRLCMVTAIHSRKFKKPESELAPHYFVRYRLKYPELDWETFMARQSAHAMHPAWEPRTDSSLPAAILVSVGKRDDLDIEPEGAHGP